jgi:hypothetical protein
MNEAPPVKSARSLGSTLAALVVYSAGMGWLEAVVVVYIRAVIGLPHANWNPDVGEVMAKLQAVPWLIPTEQGREAATILMLAGVGWLAAPSWRERFGAFLICFGVWDITYYIGLHALIGWPRTLADMDVLFLIPPSPLWRQPVWVPVLVSCGMIATGVWMMRRAAGRTDRSRNS